MRSCMGLHSGGVGDLSQIFPDLCRSGSLWSQGILGKRAGWRDHCLLPERGPGRDTILSGPLRET